LASFEVCFRNWEILQETTPSTTTTTTMATTTSGAEKMEILTFLMIFGFFIVNEF
jgi:hypothetical protein